MNVRNQALLLSPFVGCQCRQLSNPPFGRQTQQIAGMISHLHFPCGALNHFNTSGCSILVDCHSRCACAKPPGPGAHSSTITGLGISMRRQATPRGDA
jgi:hypothetical protein